MCGFLAEFPFQTTSLSSRAHFETLLSLSKHRGPNNTKIESTSNYQLGFNRLAILDLSSEGDQPMYSPKRHYHVVFNGEIYNYKSLAKAYDLTNLHSTSDTEVLVHLIAKLGVEQAIIELNGMFTICVIDTQTSTLYLTRDFAGIKPLFFGLSEVGLIAASQFDQIYKHCWFKDHLRLRPDVMKEYFGFGYMQAPNTIYESIFQVNPGELIKVTQDGSLTRKLLYNLDFTPFKNKSLDAVSNQTDNLLQDAVKMQLASDVPLATFLSGGVDSPLVTAIAKQQDDAITGFTVKVDDDTLDESQVASLYAKHIDLEHEIQQIDTNTLLHAINSHFDNMPEPFGDYSSIPTFQITKLAQRKFTVMLSGDGGDELFFGYPRMLDVITKRHWFKIPFIIRKPIVRLGIKLNIFKSWAPYNYRTISDWYWAKHCHIPNSFLDSFFQNITVSKEFKKLYTYAGGHNIKTLMRWMRLNEFYGHLQRVLIKVDRMSMANSLEVRVPFLDKSIIEEAFSFQPDTFKSRKHMKQVLKDIMKNYYPDTLIHHHKQGFSVPIDSWLHNALQDDVRHVILNMPIYGTDVINTDALKSFVIDYFEGKHDAAWGVWHIYAWQKWAVNQGFV